MPFANRSDLRTSIRSWLMRPSDTTELTDAMLNDIIALAEAEFFDILDLNDVETHNAAFSVTAEYTALPTGFRGFRRDPRVISDAAVYRLILASPDQMTDETDGSTTDSPRLYCIEGNQLRLAPIPANTTTLDIAYFGRPAAIADATTNIILTNYPNIYLFGSLVNSAPFIGEDGRMAMWKAKYDQGVAIAQRTARLIKYRTGGEMRLVGATP